jgi:hypothetical protein
MTDHKHQRSSGLYNSGESGLIPRYRWSEFTKLVLKKTLAGEVGNQFPSLNENHGAILTSQAWFFYGSQARAWYGRTTLVVRKGQLGRARRTWCGGNI